MLTIDQTTSNSLSQPILLALIGGFIIGVSGKVAVYRERDPKLGQNVWRDRWEHGAIVDASAFFGVAVMGFGLLRAALPLIAN
jgi:hypothetical protein